MSETFPIAPFTAHELNLRIDYDAETGFIARVLHKPTGTLKISDWCLTKEEAVKQVIADLDEFLKLRLQGLGR